MGVGGESAKLNISHGDAGMFLINPEAVIFAVKANHFNDFGCGQLPHTKKPYYFTSRESIFNHRHLASLSFNSGFCFKPSSRSLYVRMI
jgi:hypothetical protein